MSLHEMMNKQKSNELESIVLAEQLNKENRELLEKVGNLDKELKKEQAANETVNSQLTSMKGNNNILTRKIEKLEIQLKELEKKERKLQLTIQGKAEESKEEKEESKRLIRQNNYYRKKVVFAGYSELLFETALLINILTNSMVMSYEKLFEIYKTGITFFFSPSKLFFWLCVFLINAIIGGVAGYIVVKIKSYTEDDF